MIIYDFEVFCKDWLVYFIVNPTNLNNSYKKLIVNDRQSLLNFYHEHKNEVFCGFNNHHYDDLIFAFLLSGHKNENVKALNDAIVLKNDKNLLYTAYSDLRIFPLLSLDLSEFTSFLSLKEMEAFMGLPITESSVDFKIDRKLTENELNEVAEYCLRDVEATSHLATKFKTQIFSKLQLIKEFKVPINFISKTNAVITSKILNAVKRPFNDEFKPFEVIQPLNIKNKEVVNFFTQNKLTEKMKMTVDVAGIPHTFALGGLHGARKKFKHFGEIWCLDVASYYPSIMIEWGYMPRTIMPEMSQKFKKIYSDRLKMKESGEKDKAKVYKIIINAVYGCMNHERSDFYDPHNLHNVCIAGQLMMLDLIEGLAPFMTLIQSNTDGIIFVPHEDKKCDIMSFYKNWEQRMRMTLELSKVDKIYQKDVNNYILGNNGKILKLKGGYVAKCSQNRDNMRVSGQIIADAIVNFLLNNTAPEKTIGDCSDLQKFQIITKSGKNYFKNEWEASGENFDVNRVNRIYATIDPNCGKIYKTKMFTNKDGVVTESRQKQASLPERCFVDNNNEFDIKNLDKQWYINVAKSRIEDFIGNF
jgi:DNA polymerase elongation subunit (family B)